MQNILHQLRSGGDDQFQSIYTVVPWLEWPVAHLSWEERLAGFEQLPDPRIFKTHCLYEQTPGVDTVKIILTSRDPRDCCVSFYHHLLDMTDEARHRRGITAPESFDTYFDRWLSYGAWFRNVASWWPHINDDNVLWLRYEDLKADFPAALQRIGAFLGWTIPPESRSRILEYCSFSWMKAHAEKFIRTDDDGQPMFRPGGFIRKGVSGDYHSLLRPEHEQRILDKARQMLPPECLAFLGIG